MPASPSHNPSPLLASFPPPDSFLPLIRLALLEDLGPHYHSVGLQADLTSRLTLPDSQSASATLLLKQPGIPCGLPLVAHVARIYDPRLTVEPLPGSPLDGLEGHYFSSVPLPLLRISGPLRSLLAAERVLLNFLQHLSGIATLTHQYVSAVHGTHAQILDTRKTIPAYRALAKYAVRAGGGHNHRIGLYDGILIKDNHLAHIPLPDIAPWLQSLVHRAHAEPAAKLFEVEVDTLAQLKEVLKVDLSPPQRNLPVGAASAALPPSPKAPDAHPGPPLPAAQSSTNPSPTSSLIPHPSSLIPIILLDNMPPPLLAQAVLLRDAAGLRNRLLLEASGGVNLQTVRPIALSGVDRISIGALTHSAPALDLGLDVETP